MSKFDNPTYGSHAPENETNATHEDENVFCPVNAYGDCPYCDQCNLCHVGDPMENCDDFAIFFESWEEWEELKILPSPLTSIQEYAIIQLLQEKGLMKMTNKKRIDLLREYWGREVVDDIVTAIATNYPQTMTMDEFLSHCTACGCNWGGMLLNGIKKLWPHVWDAIPKDMGIYTLECICATIGLCGVRLED